MLKSKEKAKPNLKFSKIAAPVPPPKFEKAETSPSNAPKANIFGMLGRFSIKKHQEQEVVPKVELKAEAKPEPVKAQSEIQLTGLSPLALQQEKKKDEKKELPKVIATPKKEDIKLIATYNFTSDNIPITIKIYKRKGEFVPVYDVSISTITKPTEFILEKIREELTTQVNLGMVDILTTKDTGIIEQRFMEAITTLVNKHFPDADEKTTNFLKSYLIQRSLGLGSIEILMDDANLEEVAINDAEEPVWVYHVKYGCKARSR